MTELAMLGGPRAASTDVASTKWPVVTSEDEQAVARVLRSGKLTATAAQEKEVVSLETEWAAFTGVDYCAGVGSGTAAIQLALAALGVGPGDEVIVPALSMNATALAVCQQRAVPVFVDIDPVSFTLDPTSLAAAVTDRTVAVVPVHLHGLPADMNAIRAVTESLGLPIVEDAAQSHGASYRGMRTGALGAVGCFSLHPSKNLPSCGEGGLLTTRSGEIHEMVVKLRQFGEDIQPRETRTYVAYDAGWNHKLSPVQAAFARTQLRRLPAYTSRRAEGVNQFLSRLAELPGIRVPTCPDDRTHAWHILRFRVVPEELGLDGVPPGALRQALYRALRAEGVPVSRYQTLPLPAQPAFALSLGSHIQRVEHLVEECPTAFAVLEDSLCLQRRHLNPDSAKTLMAYADGFEKVWGHMEIVSRYAREIPYRPSWTVEQTAV